jgi:hypothetical protein
MFARLRGRSFVAALVGLAGVAGCGGAPGDGPSLVFSGPVALSVASASGALTFAVRFSPQTPVVGLDAAELSITDADGASVPGLTVTVVPWMPAHGHGSSTTPTVSETSPGVYVATPLALPMPGEWELRTTVSGPLDDTVAPSLVLQ